VPRESKETVHSNEGIKTKEGRKKKKKTSREERA
jgi:hypothetical protein